jgi:hypothetical protein
MFTDAIQTMIRSRRSDYAVGGRRAAIVSATGLTAVLLVQGCVAASAPELGGTPLSIAEERMVSRVAGAGVAPELSAYQSPEVGRAGQGIEIMRDGSAPAGIYFVYRNLSPDATYTVTVRGRSLVGSVSLRSRLGHDAPYATRAPRGGFNDFTFSGVETLELLFHASEAFAYRLDTVTVEACEPCRVATKMRRTLTSAYILQLLMVSMALGVVGLLSPRMLPGPRAARFLTGFAMAPFAVGAWVMLLGVALPGSSRWFFLLPPVGVAFAVLAMRGRTALRYLARAYRRTHRLSRGRGFAYSAYAGLIAVMFVLAGVLIANGSATMIAHDALVYLGEALYFAGSPGAVNMAGMADSFDGMFRGDYHGFMFPAFLSHALMSLHPGFLEFPGPQVLGAPFQLTVIYMLLAVAAGAAAARQLGAAALAIVLVMLASPLEHISYSLGRDAFRIIPLMLLIAVLSSMGGRTRGRWLAYATVFVLSASALAGHTLGGPVVVTIVAAWSLACLLQRKGLGTSVVLVAACGLLFGGVRYIDSYVETGRLLGESDGNLAVQGSLADEDPAPLEQEYATVQRTSVFTRIGWFMALDQYRLSVLGLLSAAAGLIAWPWLRETRHSHRVLFASLTVGFGLLPFLGAFDWLGPSPLSEVLLTNYRYVLHWYPIAALNTALVACAAYDVSVRSAPTGRLAIRAVFLTLGIVVAAGSVHTVSSKWRTASLRHDAWFDANIAPLQSVAGRLKPGERLLLDDDRFVYYLGRKGLMLYTRPTWSLIRAQDRDETRAELERLRVGAAALTLPVQRWDEIPLGGTLRESGSRPPWGQTDIHRVVVLDGEGVSKP